MKGPNGKTVRFYLKVNANTGQLHYFQENPDVRRNTSQRASQTDNTQQQEQKKAKNRLSDLNGIQINQIINY